MQSSSPNLSPLHQNDFIQTLDFIILIEYGDARDYHENGYHDGEGKCGHFPSNDIVYCLSAILKQVQMTKVGSYYDNTSNYSLGKWTINNRIRTERGINEMYSIS